LDRPSLSGAGLQWGLVLLPVFNSNGDLSLENLARAPPAIYPQEKEIRERPIFLPIPHTRPKAGTKSPSYPVEITYDTLDTARLLQPPPSSIMSYTRIK